MTVGSNLDWTGIDLSGGRYHVTAKLGEGGMGFVFVARDNRLQADVVIKVPRGNVPDDEFVQRFSREIRSLVRLSHPHIVKITDVDEHDGLPFAVMQFLSGGSLEDRQRRQREQPIPERLRNTLQWLQSVANALDFVSAQGFVHRDVKPANILFDEHGNAYLSDFGVAKVLASEQGQDAKQGFTRAGMVLGTPEYMAPELIMGKTIDGRIDQYALAVTVFECLSGRRPIEGSTANGIYVAQVTQPPLDLGTAIPGIPASISEVVKRALSKDPSNRFPTSTAFANAFDAAVRDALHSQPTPARQPHQKTQQTPTHRPSAETPAARHDPTKGHRVAQLECAEPKPEPAASGVTPPKSPTKASLGRRLLVCLLAAVIVPLAALPFLHKDKQPLGNVRLAFVPPDVNNVEVSIDERAIGDDELSKAIALSPGKHTLRATAATFDPFQKEFELRDADDIILTVAFKPSSEPPATDQPRTPEPEAPPSKSVSVEPPPPPITNSIGMQLILVPAGEFTMGSPDSEGGEAADESQHPVRITKPYYIGVYEVTQDEFLRVMGRNPSWFSITGFGKDRIRRIAVTKNLPVECVSWDDAKEFCRRLSELSEEKAAGRRYRLPTEAEWEYACRARTSSAYAFGDVLDERHANFNSLLSGDASWPSLDRTATVNQYPPNAFDVYGMHGNIYEWCSDWYEQGYYARSPIDDPTGPVAGEQHVLRGGSWKSPAASCRSAARLQDANPSPNEIGFRVAM